MIIAELVVDLGVDLGELHLRMRRLIVASRLAIN
jgi:hypothetical protein